MKMSSSSRVPQHTYKHYYTNTPSQNVNTKSFYSRLFGNNSNKVSGEEVSGGSQEKQQLSSSSSLSTNRPAKPDLKKVVEVKGTSQVDGALKKQESEKLLLPLISKNSQVNNNQYEEVQHQSMFVRISSLNNKGDKVGVFQIN
ncbi:hypothetical protein FGO68_gene14186 [Halteria grandinella]|uniref:Uncharacterized protein n=1 Tax=Halteria grandinella TaxID=5974 RepID=A0A8J8P7D5_HALGN|nr:hypothetical protein FGO68_gene14186 [Halteria grandinella]